MTQRKILLICGRAYSGKSTISKYVVDNFLGWKEITLASYIKDICSSKYGLDRTMLEGGNDVDRYWREYCEVVGSKTPRDLLIEIGTQLREDDRFILPRRALEMANTSKYTDYNIVVSDCRFQDDIDYLKYNSNCNVKTVKLVRLDTPIVANEESVDALDVDHVINNNSLRDTKIMIEGILNDWEDEYA